MAGRDAVSLRWLTWREEYSQYDSNYTSYDQINSQLEGSHYLGNGVRIGWHAGVLMVQYHEEDLDRDYSDTYHAGSWFRAGSGNSVTGRWKAARAARKA
jgi:hypothetical protein